MNGAVIGAGAVLGAGLALTVRGLAPPAPTLAETIAALRTPTPRDPVTAAGPGNRATELSPSGTPPEGTSSAWASRAGRSATGALARAGLPTTRTRADLALLAHPPDVHLAEQATAAVVGAVVVPAMAGVLALAGIDALVANWLIPAWGCLLLGGAGFLTPTLVARTKAAARRAEFVHALGAFLDLVVIGLAGGAGVDAALTDASRIGHGWSFDRLAQTLQAAQITRVTPWDALGDLGEELRVPVLREVAAAIGLAGTEGARVRQSLAAKASGLRLRELTSAEAKAVAATEQMSVPVIVMFAGFLLFVGFPAVVHVLGAL